MQDLAEYCDANSIGLSEVKSENIRIIIMGQDMNPNVGALLAARFLIEGVLSGAWTKLNETPEIQRQRDELKESLN